MKFEIFIGIDYSGAQTPTSRLKALQVYAARPGTAPEKQSSPSRSNNGQAVNWTRKEIAHHLIGLARRGERFIAGIDHGFSLPLTYFDRYGLGDWPAFLDLSWAANVQVLADHFLEEGSTRHWPVEDLGEGEFRLDH